MTKSSSSASPFLSPGGMSLASSVNMEIEGPWSAAQASADLKKACQVLSDRGLKLASKWAAEQWIGLPPEVIDTTNVESSTISDHLMFVETSPVVYYAKTLLDMGDFAEAAAILSQSASNKTTSVESMSPPLRDLSPFAFYLRVYALFMAGERRKEEKHLESSDGQQHSLARNPYLQQLLGELLDSYEAEQLDAFGLHVYGMVLNAGKKAVIPPGSPEAHSVLMQSILEFPYNWSAWMDLAECALDDRDVERDIEERLQPTLSDNFMYHFFCAHLQAEHQAHPEALQIYERWMDPSFFSGSPYLMSQVAIVQYHLRQFSAAKTILEDLHNHMPYRLDSMDVFSNILYVQEDSVALSQLAHTAVQVDKYRAETCCIVGNYYSLKQQRAKAIEYFQRALKMDRRFTSAWTLMGHEYVEWKQTPNAMEAYRRAVQVTPKDYRAWYGLGQTYEFLNMNLYALYYYKQAAQLRPYDARMWCAVGMAYSQLGRVGDSIRAYERALDQDDTEGVATQKLAALYKQENQHEKAAQCYFRHLEIRYQITHAKDASLQPVSLDAMVQSIYVESTEAEALLYLANYYKDNYELDTAALFASRLLEYPGNEKEEAKALLRELRSRKATGSRRPVQTRSQGPLSDPTFEFSP